ncbi:MAG: ankyrin repeat domain-containing protein [Bacteroidales bacterium]
MKSLILITVLFSNLNLSCVYSNYKDKQREIEDSIALAKASQIQHENNLDYSNADISKDSLDIKLYELIAYSYDMSEETLLKKMDILLKSGAKPDALVEITYSVRKPGSYIPIIKEFYQNKYRNYTTITTSVHAAAGCHKTQVMKKLVENGANLNIQDKDGRYPIDFAIKNNDPEMVNFMMDKGCDIKKANLAMCENVNMLESLVTKGADAKTIDINFALTDKQKLKRVLDLKPDINGKELDFNLIMNDNELFDIMIANGLKPEAKGKFPDGCPAIIAAIKYNNFNAFSKLHKMGADLNMVCQSGFMETPMQTAVYYQRMDVIRYLLEHKVNPNEKDWTGKSVLYKAVGTDNDQIINILIDAGAKIDDHQYFEKTPLMEAANSGHYISAQTLINRKANLNFRNKYGETALLLAVKKNDLPMIKLLIENGASTDNGQGSKSLIEIAREENAPNMIIEYLKSKGAK